MNHRTTALCSLFLAFFLSLTAVQAASVFRDAVAGHEPMSLEGLDPKVAAVLEKYYEASFGGPENWAKIKDLRFEGVLFLPAGEFPFFGYQKKPDFSKTILYGRGSSQVVMAYDGTDAWQILPPSRSPVDMPAAEAADFVRDAPMGGLLLYPTLPGKRIEALGTRRVGEYRCRDLRVTLPDGRQVTYAIDLKTGYERQKITTSAATGKVETHTHRRWDAYHSIVVLAESTMTIDGREVFTSRIEDVVVNAGLAEGMFDRPPTINTGFSSGQANLDGPFQLPGLYLPPPSAADEWGAASTDPDDPFKLRQSGQVDPAKQGTAQGDK